MSKNELAHYTSAAQLTSMKEAVRKRKKLKRRVTDRESNYRFRAELDTLKDSIEKEVELLSKPDCNMETTQKIMVTIAATQAMLMATGFSLLSDLLSVDEEHEEEYAEGQTRKIWQRVSICEPVYDLMNGFDPEEFEKRKGETDEEKDQDPSIFWEGLPAHINVLSSASITHLKITREIGVEAGAIRPEEFNLDDIADSEEASNKMRGGFTTDQADEFEENA